MSEPRITRREHQFQTRLKLIESAERVFARLGFDAASIEEISGDAGLSRGAFYFNFAGKDEIFLELLNQKRSETKAVLEAIFQRHADAGARYRAVRRWYSQQWRQRAWTILSAEMNLRAVRTRTLRKRVSSLWQEELEAYTAVLSRYLAETRLAPPRAANSIALALLAASQGLGMLSLVRTGPAFERQIVASLQMTFESLIPCPPPGRGRPGQAGKR